MLKKSIWDRISGAAGKMLKGKQQLGKFGKQLLAEALEQKILEMRKSPERQMLEVPVPRRKFSLAEILQSSVEEPGPTLKTAPSPVIALPKKAPIEEGVQGPIDFRKHLKRAPTRPTDSLRKGWSSESQEQ